MSGRTGKQRAAEKATTLAQGAAKFRRSTKVFLVAAPIALIAAIATGYVTFFHEEPAKSTQRHAYPRLTYTQKVKSLDELLKMTPDQIAHVDIAEMNLLCATGLPSAEKLDINRCLAKLDEWTARVNFETDRHLYKFRRDPNDYDNSEGYFRMLMLITVLQQDYGVHYNPQRIRDIDFTKSKDLFVHGMIEDENGGTCVSMPVIYTAVARRLGYPVKLALAKAHTFCRWDAPNDRFNIEATNQGMNCFDDAYYSAWPEKVSDAEIKANRYLISLSPAEELASFLASRGHCLSDTGRSQKAIDA